MSSPNPMRRRQFRLSVLAAVSAGLAFATSSLAQSVESWVVTIDSGSTQPVATGFVPTSSDGVYIILAEGAVQPFPNPTRYDDGWFGPAGQTRLQRSGQPIVDGMPYGALVGGFGTGISDYQFHGRIGSTPLAPANVGHEFHVALNMSDADLAATSGEVTVTVIHIPNGSADAAHVPLNRNAPDLVPTGFTASAGDKYIVLPYGALQCHIWMDDYTRSWFGPEGMIGFNRAGQPQTDGPFGGLYGTYTTDTAGFYIGDGGCWSVQTADYGQELKLFLNLSAADQDSLNGCGFIAHVIRIPSSTVHVEDHAVPKSMQSSTAPNPASTGTSIRFALPSAGPVSVELFDTQGARVRSLLQENRTAGTHQVWWDGRSDAGRPLPAGAYFYQVRSGADTRRGRVVLMK